MDEPYAVGCAKGIAIDPAYVDERFEFVSKIDPGIKSSMANDLERGSRLELARTERADTGERHGRLCCP
jgi:ketopantoate reductase